VNVGGTLFTAVDPPCSSGPIICGAQSIGDAIGGAVNGVGDAVGGAVETANGFANFWSDPAGNSFQMLQDGAKGLADDVLPAITHATLPDLTADWFISSYRISFGLAVFVLAALLIPQFVRTARGQQSGRDLAESLGLYAPLFLVGAAFGPAVGAVLVKFFGALSDSLISWGINSSAQTIVDKFSEMLGHDDNGAGLAGGAIIGIILMIFMIIGLLIVVLILIVQLITLYFSGVLFPLGFVWIVDPTKRAFGLKISYLWFGILASHPLLFFMLAIAYSMVSSTINVFDGDANLERTITLVVSILSLLIAGLSPVLLTKFAPVLPMGGSGGVPSRGGNIGSSSMQQADAKVSDSGSSSQPDNSGSASSSASAPSSTGSSSSPSSTGSSSSPGSSGAPSSAGTGAGSEDASSSISAATKGNAAGGEAASGGAAAEGATAATAAESAAAAGAAESSTGVGAAIGIPTMIVAGAMAAGDATKKVSDSVGAAAAEPVEDQDEHYGKDSTS
jgi:type IV secretion system protein TrbL